MKEFKTAVIGCGKVGMTHAQCFGKLESSRLSAVCDVDRARAEAFGKKFGVPAYTDATAMIRENGIDAVAVCTPHPLHAVHIVNAAKNGAHVISEKPLAASLQDCDLAIAACEKAGVKLGVISQRRYYPPFLRMVEAIRAGKIGRPTSATLEVMGWRSPEYYEMDSWRGKWIEEGGGVMINQTPHQIDLLLSVMGDVDELFGLWDNFNHPTVEIEDSAMALIRFKSGAIGQLYVSNSQKPGLWGKLHVHGSNGASIGAQIEGGSSFISGVTAKVEPPFNDIWTIPGEENRLPDWKAKDAAFTETHDPMSYYHELQLRDFLDAIANGREPLVNGVAGRKTVELITAIYRSQRDHQAIRFPLTPESGPDFDGRTSHPLYSRTIGANS